MIDRPALALAVGARGEDPSRSKGERASRRRSQRAPQHTWVERDDGDLECRWCRPRRSWPGAGEGCGNAHAKNMASHTARRNDEVPAVDAARTSGTATTGES